MCVHQVDSKRLWHSSSLKKEGGGLKLFKKYRIINNILEQNTTFCSYSNSGRGPKISVRDTNLVLDSATQSWTGYKSGTSNVYPLSNITKR